MTSIIRTHRILTTIHFCSECYKDSRTFPSSMILQSHMLCYSGSIQWFAKTRTCQMFPCIVHALYGGCKRWQWAADRIFAADITLKLHQCSGCCYLIAGEYHAGVFAGRGGVFTAEESESGWSSSRIGTKSHLLFSCTLLIPPPLTVWSSGHAVTGWRRPCLPARSDHDYRGQHG